MLHLHGTLGEYIPDEFNWAEGQQATPDEIGDLAPKLQLFFEAGYDANLIARAKVAISEASRVVFLGFGYLEANIQKLIGEYPDEDPFSGSKTFVGGSAYGKQREERRRTGELFRTSMKFGNEVQDCKKFLKNYNAIPTG